MKQEEGRKTDREREREKRGDSCTDIYTAARLLKVVECCRLQIPDQLPAGPLHSGPEWFYRLKKEEKQGVESVVITWRAKNWDQTLKKIYIERLFFLNN